MVTAKKISKARTPDEFDDKRSCKPSFYVVNYAYSEVKKMFDEFRKKWKYDHSIAYPRVAWGELSTLDVMLEMAHGDVGEDHDCIVYIAQSEFDSQDEVACKRIIEYVLLKNGIRVGNSDFTELELTSCVIPYQSVEAYLDFAGDEANENIIQAIEDRKAREVSTELAHANSLRKTYVPVSRFGSSLSSAISSYYKHEKYPTVTNIELRRDRERTWQKPILSEPFGLFIVFLWILFIVKIIADAKYG